MPWLTASPPTDLVEEWKQRALALARARRRQRDGERSIHFRITPGFVLVATLAGSPWASVGAAAAFVALTSAMLVQQLPTAALQRGRGIGCRITLSALGDEVEPVARGRLGMLGTALGSASNLTLGASLLALVGSGTAANPLVELLAFTHVAWALGQALPLMPFFAGRLVANALSPSGRLLHAGLSLGCVGLAASFLSRGLGVGPALPALVLSGMAAAGNCRRAALALRRQQHELGERIASAERALQRDEPARAFCLAEAALVEAELEEDRTRLRLLLTWAAIGKGDPFTAHGMMQLLPGSKLTLDLVAAYLACCNRNAEAILLLRQGRALGARAPETTKLLLELLVKTGAWTEVSALAEEDQQLLSPAEIATLRAALNAPWSRARPSS